MVADSFDVCAAIWLAMSSLLPVATYLFVKSFNGLCNAAAAADHFGSKTPSHRKAQRAQWRRGSRPRRRNRPRHYLVEGHLTIRYGRLWRNHHRPMSTSSHEFEYDYTTTSIFDRPSNLDIYERPSRFVIFDRPSVHDLTTSHQDGWARRLVSAIFKPMLQWLMYVFRFAEVLMGWLWVALKVAVWFIGCSRVISMALAAPAIIAQMANGTAFFFVSTYTDRGSCIILQVQLGMMACALLLGAIHDGILGQLMKGIRILLTFYLLLGEDPLDDVTPALVRNDSLDSVLLNATAMMANVPNVALQPWPSSKVVRFDSDSFPIGIDTQASRCISYNMAHFEDLHLDDVDSSSSCEGLDGTSVRIHGYGTLVFSIQDDQGRSHVIRVPNSLFIPKAKRVLICPQHWAQEANDDHPKPFGTCELTTRQGTVLMWDQRKFQRTLYLHPYTNTPIFYSRAGNRIIEAFTSTYLAMDASGIVPREQSIVLPPGSLLSNDDAHGDAWIGEELINAAPSADAPCPIHQGSTHKWGECREYKALYSTESNSVLSSIDDEAVGALESSDRVAELLRYHYRLGHLSFSKLRLLAKLGEIPRALADVVPPKCAGCLFGAMTRVKWRTKPSKHDPGSEIFPATRPGQVVSVDQMQSTSIGFFAQLKGRLTKRRYTCSTVFVDNYSRYRYVHMQETTSSKDTIAVKNAFELHAMSMGVTISHYHCDNGRFQDNAFLNSCRDNHQRISFCGVNAHNQNSIAERAIRDITEQARKMLLFAIGRWPRALDLSLWPYAVRTATFIHNQLPCDEEGRSRLELFGGTAVRTNISIFHTFGCPVYALDSDLASGKSISRWMPRARLGLCLGPSPSHARSVSLVLNLSTGLVSPQFHCRHDDFFETVKEDQAGSHYPWKYVAKLLEETSSLAGSTDDAAAASDISLNSPSINFAALPEGAEDVLREIAPDAPSEGALPALPEGAPHTLPEGALHTLPEGAPPGGAAASAVDDATPPSLPSPSISSRGRVRMPSQRLQESLDPSARAWGNSSRSYVGMSSTIDEPMPIDHDAEHDEHLLLQERMRHPIAFHAEMVGDTMYYHQAMRQQDAPQFVDAIVKEVNGHVDNNTWELVPRKEVPESQEIVPSVWSMRRKRDLTTGEVVKWKARLNLHGGKQTYGVNYYETWSPVVGWFSVRLLICFALIQKWSIRQVDFVQAFCQAPIEMDMYMELPHGISVKGGSNKTHVLKLLANIYGQKQGGKIWHDYLVDKLISIGFSRSSVDSCVFYRGTTIFILYVDDGLAFDISGDVLDNLIQEMTDTGLNIEDLGQPSDYIGVNLSREEGVFHFTQRALIDSILSDVGLANSNKTKPVPAKPSVILHKYPDSPDFDGPFSFRSLVGKLNYLGQTTRPDIVQAVHSIAKFSSNPKKEHGDAIMYLAMYLNKTRHIGLRFKPDPSKGFEDYCDADFIGQYHKEHATGQLDPSVAKSRSGWIVFYAGCPIIWASKLQTQVALSTTEAEYISLSSSLRDVIPIMSLVSEMKSRGFDVPCTEPHVYCKLFEDNSGALEIARLPKMRPRTKHLCASLHHFREFVRLGLVKIFPIATDMQTADILTKPTPQNIFVPHRVKICGQ